MNIAFANLVDNEGTPVDFSVSGYSGHEIDHSDRAGQVTINISGRDKAGGLLYDTVVDLDLPVARAFAAAIKTMANHVERIDRDNAKRRKGRPK
jgi:hypothetical protein